MPTIGYVTQLCVIYFYTVHLGPKHFGTLGTAGTLGEVVVVVVFGWGPWHPMNMS